MKIGLTGKTALITGAGSGLGRATALALAAEQALVIVSDINPEAAQATVNTIINSGGQARWVSCDVADEASVAAAVANVIAHEDQLDVMVNNAGIGPPLVPLISSDVADWDRLYTVNLRGVFLGIKHAAHAMSNAGSGCIINIASVAGLAGMPLGGPYAATKAAVINLTQTAALELARFNIRVNAICPGWTETPILGDLNRNTLTSQIPLGRIGQPGEIAAMVVYLASDAATFITGSAFRIDGGIRS